MVGNYGLDKYRYVTEGSFEGRALYYNGSQWGTICDDNFNQTTADLFCRSLNPRFGVVNWTNIDNLDYDRQNDFKPWSPN